MIKRVVFFTWIIMVGKTATFPDNTVEGVIALGKGMTTLKGCMDGTNCCNKAWAEMYFKTGNDNLILFQFDTTYPVMSNCRSGPDSVLQCDSILYLSPDGAYKCRTENACEPFNCGPFYENRRYKLTGYFITEYHLIDNPNAKCFKVNRYELLEERK